MIAARFLPPIAGIPTSSAAIAPPPPFSNRNSTESGRTSNSIMGRYQMGDKIGEGSFGIVYRATDKKSGALRAIKHIRSYTNGSSGSSSTMKTGTKPITYQHFTWDEMYKMRELQSLMRVPHHSNIVQLYEVHRDHNGMISFVMEYMSHGTLLGLMEDHSNTPCGSSDGNKNNSLTDSLHTKTKISHHIVRHLVHQILLGVQHLHAHHICHRDLKPENILLGPNYLCKIADFSLARAFDETSVPTSYVSTRWYRAPEILLRTTDYASPVDIWAIGCIASELYTCEPLFPGRDECDQLHLIFTAFGTPQMVDWKDGIQLLKTSNIHSWQKRRSDFHDSPQTFMAKTLSSNIFFSTDKVETSVVVEFLLSLLTLDPAQRSDSTVALQHNYFSDSAATTSPVKAFENVLFQKSHGRQGIEPSTVMNSDKENREIPNTHQRFGSNNNVKNPFSTIVSPQNPVHENRDRNMMLDGNDDVASNVKRPSLDNNRKALHDRSSIVPLPLLHKHNPYKKGRV